MIVIFVGAQGSGKTISIVKYLVQDFAKGKNILTNFGMNHIKYNIITKKQILDYSKNKEQINNTSLGLTELHTLIDSRSSNKNKGLTHFFLQLRKRDVTLYGDTQHFGQIDKRVRDETDIFIECGTYLLDSTTNKLKVTYKKHFDKDEFERLYIKNKCFVKYIIDGIQCFRIKSHYFKADHLAKYYDTTEVVDISQ